MLVAVLCVTSLVDLCLGDATRDLTKLEKEYFDWRMSDRPEVASSYNILKYDDQVESYDMAMFQVRKKKADEFYKRLKNIDRSKVRESDRINYDVLEDVLVTYIDGYKWRLYQYLTPPSVMGGPQLEPFDISTESYFTQGDYINYIIQLEKKPKLYQEMITMMKEAIRLNRTNSEWSMKRLKGMFARVNVSQPEESGFYLPFKDKLNASSISDADKEAIRTRGRHAVQGTVDALMKMWVFIEQEYMPNTRQAVGVWSLDNGTDYYQALIKWYLSVDMTAQEIHDIGLREVDRIARQMRKIITKQGFNGTIREYFDSLLKNPKFTFATSNDVLNAYRYIVKNVEKLLPKYFDNVPDLPLEVSPIPYDGPVAYYSPGTKDGSRAGVFFVNTKRPRQVTNYSMAALALHEATPGHHLQISYSLLADVPDFRSKYEWTSLHRAPFAAPVYTAYIEGWGLYAEALGEEMSVYTDDYDLMGRYSLDMLRACRLVVDTGMHAFRWTRNKSIEYLKMYTAEPIVTIEHEIDRYITLPGQALSYKIGEMKLWELRRKAEKQLGQKFNLKSFHTVVLDKSNLPLTLLEKVVDEWIKRENPLTLLEKVVDEWIKREKMSTTPPSTCGASCVVQMYTWTVIAFTILVSY